MFFVFRSEPPLEFLKGFYRVDVHLCEAREYGLSCCTRVFFLGVIGVLAAQVGEGMVRVWPSGASGSGFAGDRTC